LAGVPSSFPLLASSAAGGGVLYKSVRAVTFDLIAFDADDTLWHNERSYRDARQRFCQVLAAAGVTLDQDAIDEQVNRVEIANLDLYGYGVSSFALSLIETAIELSGGRITGEGIREIVALSKEMLREDVEVFPNVSDVLASLAATYPLMLITKGDLLHQTSKLERSGLRDYFRAVEVVSHKTSDTYARILSRHRIDAGRFLMVGNSLRSDVLPILELGGWAVHVPAALSWSHEHAVVPEEVKGRYVEAAALDRLPDLIDRAFTSEF
jgi:putative hydrolase of the HAD superfamily